MSWGGGEDPDCRISVAIRGCRRLRGWGRREASQPRGRPAKRPVRVNRRQRGADGPTPPGEARETPRPRGERGRATGGAARRGGGR